MRLRGGENNLLTGNFYAYNNWAFQGGPRGNNINNRNTKIMILKQFLLCGVAGVWLAEQGRAENSARGTPIDNANEE